MGQWMLLDFEWQLKATRINPTLEDPFRGTTA